MIIIIIIKNSYDIFGEIVTRHSGNLNIISRHLICLHVELKILLELKARMRHA